MDAFPAKLLTTCLSLSIGIPFGVSTPALAQTLPIDSLPSDLRVAQPLLISQSIDAGVLQLQDSGSAVEQLQSQLTSLGFYDGPITGFFGPLTEDAVIRFQQANGLSPDGIVGSATQTALERSLNARSQSFSTPSASDTGLLQLEAQGEPVTALQTRLQELGYYDGPITGLFGPLTEDAVIRFQQDRGLTPDGVVGPATQTALGRSPSTPQQSFSTPVAANDGLLQLEDRGEAVRSLQIRLQELGYYNGPITDFFGTLTEDAVIRFQQDRGLTPDGVVGPATQTALSRRVSSVPPTFAPATTPSAQVVVPRTSVPSTSFSTTSGGLLQRGDTGTAVATLQTRLRELGFYTGAITGQFDATTEAAVIAFQRSQGLSADGIVGAQTSASLRLSDIQTPQGGRYSVLELQRRLRDLQLYSGPLDGILSTETRTAIQAAQNRFNVSETDIVNGRF